MRRFCHFAILLAVLQSPLPASDDWFGGLEQTGPITTDRDDLFSEDEAQDAAPDLIQINYSSPEEAHVVEEWQAVMGYSGSRTPGGVDDLLTDLQARVEETSGADPRAMLAYSKALITYADRPQYRHQMSGMLRMAGVYADYMASGRTEASEGQVEEALRIAEYLQGSEGEELDEDARDRLTEAEREALEEADQLLAAGRLEEAEAQIRLAAHLSRFRNPEVLGRLRDVLRDLAAEETDPEAAAQMTAEANFIDRTLGEGDAADELLEESPTGQSEAIEPTASSEEVTAGLQRAEELLEAEDHTAALDELRDTVIDSGFRSARARFQLARQYLRMAEIPEYRSRRTEFERLGNSHLAEARQLGGRFLEDYPHNQQYADEARDLAEDGAELSVTPPQEAEVDTLIRRALALNEENELQQGLDVLNEAVEVSNGRSAKAHYFKGKQHALLMRANQDRVSNQTAARESFATAISLASQHLDQYSHNREWAAHAEDRLSELGASAGEEIETPQDPQGEDGDGNRYIVTASSLNFREQPEGSIMRTLPFRTIVTVLSTEGDWVRITVDGDQGYVHRDYLDAATPQRLANMQQELIAPCNGPVTSPYGMRVHPIHDTRRMHGGLDVGAGLGTPLKAMANGEIIAVGTEGGCGKVVRVRYDNGYESRYCHMRNYRGSSGRSRVNQRVVQGEVVGQVNSTGSSTGHHLHLEMRRNGERLSPAPLLGIRNARGERL